MRHFHLLKNQTYCPTINLEQIWALVPEEVQKQAASMKDKLPVVDVTKYGYFKVLGKGRLPEQPMIIKSRYFSELAEQRIKAAGGVCIVSA